MLPRIHHNLITWIDIYYRRLVRVAVGDPYHDGKVVECASKGNRQHAAEVEQELRCSIFEY